MIAHPRGYELDEALMKTIHEQASATGGSVEVTNNFDAAFDGAEVVYAKSWGAKQFYENWNEKSRSARSFAASGLSTRTRWRDQRRYLHALLPVRRNVIVTDAVIDSPASVVIDEAENRLMPKGDNDETASSES